ncbi:MAG TPA: hypothetical protein VER11_01000 [Polyangiaceae bacterium]|nr:hypothetical protein [Polyangiaceae bacterium]
MASRAFERGLGVLSLLILSSACGGGSDAASNAGGSSGNMPAGDAGAAQTNGGSGNHGGAPAASGGAPSANGGASAGTNQAGGPTSNGESPSVAGCDVLPKDHIFNTPIDALPAHASSTDFMKAVGTHNIHLDLGTTVDPTSDEYYGIPYNVVHSKTLAWQGALYTTADQDMDWDPTEESDCAVGANHQLTSPCTGAAATKAQFPIPATPLVEGGIVSDPAQPYGDHHLLLLDADTCSLWELYHVYPDPKGGWDIFGSAYFDLKSNALRPAGWTSADAAGFPIMPLLLRADEANSGTIRHALRFTIESNKIRTEYTWPARHLTGNGTSSMSLPPMGQAFRIKSSYVIPSKFNTQSRAIIQALKTYGMYLADGGSSMYIQGEPSSGWEDDTFSQVQSVSSSEFEAVDLGPIAARPGFDPDSAAVP